ncbi:30S ribosomal protein S13 [Candidatus Berkelbacteria bacterium]|nr:30S ribosomal protein S13 [Candidatus Berkelbacteria bacterium]
MARIAGVNLPGEKPIQIALTAIYGIGRAQASSILATAKIEPGARTHTLTNDQLERMRELIEKHHTVEGELRMKTTQHIKRLIEVGTYRGSRHTKKLPARGQRTRTNARTKRGKRVTMGSGRKPSAAKT